MGLDYTPQAHARQVLGEIGLATAEPVLQVTHTGLPFMGQDVHDLEPNRMGHGPSDEGHLLETRGHSRLPYIQYSIYRYYPIATVVTQ